MLDVCSSPPVRQCLEDGGHEDPRDGLVEDGVADPHDVHHGGGPQHWQHVGGHALPEVQQEALDLHERNAARLSIL